MRKILMILVFFGSIMEAISEAEAGGSRYSVTMVDFEAPEAA